MPRTPSRASSSRTTRLPTSGRSPGRSPARSRCRTGRSSLRPASGSRSRAWSSCWCVTGRSSSTTSTTTPRPRSRSSVSGRSSRPRDARRERTLCEVTARLKIREGELEGFKQQAAEMMRLTKELDTKTVRYDWFISADGTQCEVREGYKDADGLVEHAFNVKDAREELFRDYAYGHDMTI